MWDPAAADAAGGAVRFALRRRWDLRLFPAEPRAAARVLAWRPDGVLAVGRADVSGLHRRQIPAVWIGFDGADARSVCVAPDWAAACAALAGHFVGLQFRRLMLVSPSVDDADLAARREAWQAEARRAGAEAEVVAWQDEACLRRLGVPRGREGVGGGDSFSGFAPRLARYLAGAPCPVAVYIPDLPDAMELARACRAEGLAVPGRVAIATDTPAAWGEDWPGLPLTSLTLDHERLGAEAGALLERMMRGERLRPGVRLVAAARLTVRASSDATAGDDPFVGPVLRAIHARCADPRLTPAQLAAQARTSLRTLQYRFRRRLNMGVMEAVQLARVGKASALLTDAARTASEVAAACGFSDVRQLRRALRRFARLSPRSNGRGAAVVRVRTSP